VNLLRFVFRVVKILSRSVTSGINVLWILSGHVVRRHLLRFVHIADLYTKSLQKKLKK